MAGLITNDQGIGAAKTETTYGTDAFGAGAPADADVLPFAALGMEHVQEVIEGERLTATIAGECHGLHLSHNNVSWSCILTGAPAVGSAPPVDALLRAAGFKRDVDVGVSVTYAPITENNQTDTPAATILYYQRSIEDGTARRLMTRGYRGNVTLDLTVGQEARISGEGQGLYDAYPDNPASLPTLPEEYGDDACAWVVNRLVASVNSVTYPIESLTFETRWTLEVIRTGDATAGGSAGKVLLVKPKSGQRMGGSLRLVDGTSALAAAVALMKSGAKVALTASLSKGSRTITLTIPAVQLLPFGSTEAPRYDIEYAAVRADGTDGTDHVELVFT